VLNSDGTSAPGDLEKIKNDFNISIGGTKLQAARHQAAGTSPDYTELQIETALVTP